LRMFRRTSTFGSRLAVTFSGRPTVSAGSRSLFSDRLAITLGSRLSFSGRLAITLGGRPSGPSVRGMRRVASLRSTPAATNSAVRARGVKRAWRNGAPRRKVPTGGSSLSGPRAPSGRPSAPSPAWRVKAAKRIIVLGWWMRRLPRVTGLLCATSVFVLSQVRIWLTTRRPRPAEVPLNCCMRHAFHAVGA
jgi:hypothetical protein